MIESAVAVDLQTDPAPYLPGIDPETFTTRPLVVDLPSGERAVLYATYTPERFHSELYLQRDAGAEDAPDPILIGADDPNQGRNLYFVSAMDALSDGSLVLVWNHYQSTGPDQSTRDRILVVDAAGSPGTVVDVEAGSANELIESDAGAFARLWKGGALDEVWIQHHDVDGTPLAAPVMLIQTETNGGDRTTVQDVEQLADGSFAISWIDTDNDAEVPPFSQVSADTVFVRIVAAEGTPRSDAILVGDENGGSDSRNRIVPLDDGGFVVIWQTGFHFTKTQTLAQRHDSNGVGVGDPVEMPVAQYLVDAFPLSDGRYAVAFVVDNDLVLQQFTIDGQPLTAPEVIWNDMEGNPFSTSLILGADDRLLVTHEDEARVMDVGAPVLLGEGDDARTLTEAGRVHGEGGDDSLTGSDEEDALLGGDGADLLAGAGADDRIDGGAGDDTVSGGTGADLLVGADGADFLRGEDGDDTMIGGLGNDLMNGGTGDDLMMGDDTFLFSENMRDLPGIDADLSDTILGGDGNDTIGGGQGNDLAYGGIGNDSLDGGLGADTLTGQDGNDSLTGGALGDLLFGGEGDDFLNGGSGYDRLNGGTGADRFFHGTVPVHGTDWVQDYDAAEGDLLVSTREGATADWFQVNLARTTGAGEGDTDEAFVIFRPTGQILWALVDGGGQESINIQLEGGVFDLLT